MNLADFCCDFIAKLAWNVGLLYFVEACWPEQGGLDTHPIITSWLELTDSIGKEVLFGHDVMEKPQYTAKVTGIAGDGGLRLLLPDGAIVVEHSGEIRYLRPNTHF